jgi:hypothetical protein
MLIFHLIHKSLSLAFQKEGFVQVSKAIYSIPEGAEDTKTGGDKVGFCLPTFTFLQVSNIASENPLV